MEAERARVQQADQNLRARDPFLTPGTTPAPAQATPPAAVQPPFQPQPQAVSQAPIAAAAGAVGSIVFEPNDSAVRDAQRQQITALVGRLGRAGRIRVVGYGGAGVGAAAAGELARARAQAVAAEMTRQGIAASRIAVEGPGAGSGRQVDIFVEP